MSKNIGITFSGGGARAAAHIGVLQALNENGIYPKHVSGASAGALIGALYCHGYSPLEILELTKSQSFLKIFKIGFINKGLTEITLLREFLSNHIVDDFMKLKIPLYISVTNLNLGNFEVKSSGKLIECLFATCAVPLLFKPIKMDGDLFIDGGLLNNLPVEPLLDTCDKIIGVSVNIHQYEPNIKGVMEITERCLHLAVWNTIQDRIKQCDVTIEIDKSYGYSMFSLKYSDELFKIGYNYTNDKMDLILKTIN